MRCLETPLAAGAPLVLGSGTIPVLKTARRFIFFKKWPARGASMITLRALSVDLTRLQSIASMHRTTRNLRTK